MKDRRVLCWRQPFSRPFCPHRQISLLNHLHILLLFSSALCTVAFFQLQWPHAPVQLSSIDLSSACFRGPAFIGSRTFWVVGFFSGYPSKWAMLFKLFRPGCTISNNPTSCRIVRKAEGSGRCTSSHETTLVGPRHIVFLKRGIWVLTILRTTGLGN